jgi:hypothetical protein
LSLDLPSRDRTGSLKHSGGAAALKRARAESES